MSQQTYNYGAGACPHRPIEMAAIEFGLAYTALTQTASRAYGDDIQVRFQIDYGLKIYDCAPTAYTVPMAEGWWDEYGEPQAGPGEISDDLALIIRMFLMVYSTFCRELHAIHEGAEERVLGRMKLPSMRPRGVH